MGGSGRGRARATRWRAVAPDAARAPGLHRPPGGVVIAGRPAGDVRRRRVRHDLGHRARRRAASDRRASRRRPLRRLRPHGRAARDGLPRREGGCVARRELEAASHLRARPMLRGRVRTGLAAARGWRDRRAGLERRDRGGRPPPAGARPLRAGDRGRRDRPEDRGGVVSRHRDGARRRLVVGGRGRRWRGPLRRGDEPGRRLARLRDRGRAHRHLARGPAADGPRGPHGRRLRRGVLARRAPARLEGRRRQGLGQRVGRLPRRPGHLRGLLTHGATRVPSGATSAGGAGGRRRPSPGARPRRPRGGGPA